jgi:hypothetical protein
MTSIKILGISDEVLTCGCCGKSNLKRTVALDIDGDVAYYGTDCAGMALMGSKTAGNTRRGQGPRPDLRQEPVDKWTPEQVARAIWNKFGFLTEVKPGRIVVQGRARSRSDHDPGQGCPCFPGRSA